jgi:hypothetical protein
MSTHLLLGIHRGLYPFGFPINSLNKLFFGSILATCSAHPMLPDLIILIVLGENYKLCSSLLCSFLRPSAIPSLFGPNILLSTTYISIIKTRFYLILLVAQFTNSFSKSDCMASKFRAILYFCYISQKEEPS